ncbi:hypothetical protein F2Q69_00052516 [Brassica cretica]|uniref:Uncharacterized protein n=1 Tax=Brassica cretica TaxID=69181 RepID=A0A8S9N4L7_BRACR|nr:hypothetical protein F2Q69_00052516 [Brassica cretica]
MFGTHNHGEEISADTYATVMRHQFNLESLGERLQKIEDATTIMKDKWRRGDEAMQDFTEAAWGRTHFSHPIDRAIPPSIDINPSTSIDINHTTSIDIRPKPKPTVSEKDKSDNQYLIPDEFGIFMDPDKAMDGHTLHVSREDIADIHMQQRTITEHQQRVTKEFYDTAGGIDKSFKQGLDILLNHRSTLTSQHR